MRKIDAAAVRIILVFLRRFGVAAALLLATGAAQAQSAYSLRMQLVYQGRTYTVAPVSLPADQRTEVTIDPVGSLRVYVRAIALPGTDGGQALLDIQAYEPRGTSQAQVSSFTMAAFLGTQNTADFATLKGSLAVSAYVDAVGGSVAPADAAPLPSTRTTAPVDLGEPVRPKALPAPLPSPLPPPG